MLDSALEPAGFSRRRFAVGVAVSFVVHGCMIAVAVWTSPRPAKKDNPQAAVLFVDLPPWSPSVVASATVDAEHITFQSKKRDEPATALPRARATRKDIPDIKQSEQGLVNDDTEPANKLVGEAGGKDAEVGDEVGGKDAEVGGAVGGTLQPLRFDANTMTEARFISGPPLAYTEKALEHEVEGLMVVRCTVTVDGRVEHCHVVKSLPFMDSAAVAALEKRRYQPVTLDGKAIAVTDYTFNIRLKLPP